MLIGGKNNWCRWLNISVILRDFPHQSSNRVWSCTIWSEASTLYSIAAKKKKKKWVPYIPTMWLQNEGPHSFLRPFIVFVSGFLSLSLCLSPSPGWPSTRSASCSSIISQWTNTPVLSSSPAVNIGKCMHTDTRTNKHTVLHQIQEVVTDRKLQGFLALVLRVGLMSNQTSWHHNLCCYPVSSRLTVPASAGTIDQAIKLHRYTV